MAEKVVAGGYSRCVYCGCDIKAVYRFCVGCKNKRMKVYRDFVSAGMVKDEAIRRVNLCYPEKYIKVG